MAANSAPTRLRVEKTLRDRASRGRAATPSWGRTVEGAVRALLPVIEEVKPLLTWDEIAEVLAEAGVAWRNGRPVSGSDLRSVIHRLRLRARAEGVATPPSGRGILSGEVRREELSREASGHAAEGTGAGGPEGMDRARILREMARAASERRAPTSSPAKGVAAEVGGAKMNTTSPPGDPPS